MMNTVHTTKLYAVLDIINMTNYYKNNKLNESLDFHLKYKKSLKKIIIKGTIVIYIFKLKTKWTNTTAIKTF